jgi:hypothetical protein
MNRALVSALLLLVARPLLAAEPISVLELELSVEPHGFSLQALPDGSLRAELPGYPASAAPGDLRLPTRVLRLALPPGADLAALTLEVEDLSPPVWVPLAGRLERAEGPRLLCPSPGCGQKVPDRPAEPRQATQTAWLAGTGRLGPVALAEVVHRPLSLAPDGQGLLLHPRQRLRLRAPLAGPGVLLVRDPSSQRLVARAARLVANPRDLARFHPAPRDLLPDAHGVAVVAPEWLVQASQALPGYLAGLEERGFTPTLVTDLELESETGEPPDLLPQKLRAWLQRNREPLGLVYVVLLGNPDPRHGDLPMQNTYPYQPGAVDYVEEIPTDAYYADLSGNWDLDGDGRFGEWDGDRGPGGVDFYPELLVGRIPVYGDAAMADRLLTRASAYPRPAPDSAWRRRLLMPASILFYRDIPSGSTRIDGADLAVPVKLEFELGGFEAVTLAEREGVEPSFRTSDLELTEEQVLRTWREGFGLVLWIGHGSDDAAYRTLWVEDADGDLNAGPWEQASIPFAQAIHHDQLPAERPAFVFHGSCSNGTPENAANIAYTQLKTGAIASYASSRVALGTVANPWSPDPSSCEIMMAGYYVVAGLRDGDSAGQAWADARALLSDAWWGEACWHTKLATVLYGDPTLTLANCSADAECDDGLACTGQERCLDGLCAAGTEVSCAELDGGCTHGRCEEPSGTCVQDFLDGARCDDGLFCSVDDRCLAGECQGTPRTCDPLVSACIEGQCNEQAQACEAVRRPEGEACVLTRSGEEHAGACEAGMCLETDSESCSTNGGGKGSLAALLAALMFLYLSRKNR